MEPVAALLAAQARTLRGETTRALALAAPLRQHEASWIRLAATRVALALSLIHI